MQGSMRPTRLLSSLAVLGSIIALAGCSGPVFSAPIRWSNGQLVSHQDVLADPISVELLPDGKGHVTEFPQGRFVKSELGGFCVQDSGERFTGSATWSPRGTNDVEITVSGTKYLLSDGKSKFGGQTWGELRIAKCAESLTFWHLSVECGDPGPNYAKRDIPACRTS